MKRLTAALTLAALLLTGCSQVPPETTSGEAPALTPQQTTASAETAESTVPPVTVDTSELFSDRDYETEYDAAAEVITLSGTGASCDSKAVTVSGNTVTITAEGCFLLRGTLTDGMVIVDASKDDKVQLVLDNASITSASSAALYVRQADKVFVTLAENSENLLENGGSFTAIDDNNIDAAVFSKDDITLNGSGSLTVLSPAGHGIVSKDELTVTSGSYDITAASHGMTGKDSLCVADGTFTIAAGKDGLHAENDEDTSLGFVYLGGGSYDITCEGDGISAGTSLQVAGGSFRLLCGGGSANAQQQTSQNWGGFGGGMGGPGGQPGGMGGGFGGGFGGNSSSSTEDSTSIKGLKAGGDLTVLGGSFSIDAADDAIHANANVEILGGTFTIATGDDGLHADETLTVAAGTIDITESYEGLEGLNVTVSGGDIRLVSSDDGINAAGGTDGSGFGGHRGGDMFGGSGSSQITISGGSIYMNASGDGIDANGDLLISGGTVIVCGPTQGDTAVLDYDVSAQITGGTFIGTGSSMMAQTFSSSQQGVIALSVGNMTAGTRITLADSQGTLLIDYTPALDFAILILSCPEMVSGESYTVTAGDASGTFDAS